MINQVGRLVGLVLVTGLSMLGANSAHAQGTAQDEAAIRSLIRAEDNGERPPLTDDAVFASGRTVVPLVGREDIERFLDRERLVRPAERPNETRTTSIQFMVVSPAGDVAYELSSFRREWDAQGGRSFVTGTQSRVWRKINGQWRQAAVLAMTTP